MKWKDFRGSAMDEVFSIIIVEWCLALIATYCMDRVSSSTKDPFVFLKNPFKKSPSPQMLGLQKEESSVSIEMEKLDVIHEVLQNNSQPIPWSLRFSSCLEKINFLKSERKGPADDA